VLGNLGKAALALRAVQRQHLEIGGKTRRFVLPVEDQRGGQDDQGRLVEAAAFLFQQQVGQGLRRFAEAHVVSEDAGKIVLAQELQPGHALTLVRAQLETETLRRLDIGNALRGEQAFGQGHDVALATELPATDIGQLGQAGRVEARQAQDVTAGKAFEQIDQGGSQRLDAAGRDAQALAARRV